MLILETTRPVVDKARHVTLDDARIAAWAADVSPSALRPAAHELLAHLPGSKAKLANLILLIDSLNFCFWSPNPIRFEWRGKTYERFEAMLVSIMLAARYGPEWFDAEYWVAAPDDEVRQVLSGNGQLLLMEERRRIIRETGQTLIDRFDGQFIHAVESVNERAWPLAVLLMTNFDSFRDVANYHGSPVYFMKRAQICAMDLSLAWQAHDEPPLDGLEELTAFADYRLPQALRHLGILRLTPELAEMIDAEQEIPKGCDQEIEIRAATVQAVHRMCEAAHKVGKDAAAWQIDDYLWAQSHEADVRVNHHRTRTVYY